MFFYVYLLIYNQLRCFLRSENREIKNSLSLA